MIICSSLVLGIDKSIWTWNNRSYIVLSLLSNNHIVLLVLCFLTSCSSLSFVLLYLWLSYYHLLLTIYVSVNMIQNVRVQCLFYYTTYPLNNCHLVFSFFSFILKSKTDISLFYCSQNRFLIDFLDFFIIISIFYWHQFFITYF